LKLTVVCSGGQFFSQEADATQNLGSQRGQQVELVFVLGQKASFLEDFQVKIHLGVVFQFQLSAKIHEAKGAFLFEVGKDFPPEGIGQTAQDSVEIKRGPAAFEAGLFQNASHRGKQTTNPSSSLLLHVQDTLAVGEGGKSWQTEPG